MIRMFEVHAPAKLNLSLRILGRREDGFHELDTVMVRLDGLHDTLVFSEAEEFSFFCDAEGVPADGENLVVKAVRAHERASGRACRFAIRLIKRIPHGAGLGGGSSDAAAVLSTLEKQAGGVIGSGRLLGLAAELGSDVPFFLGGPCARCKGRGELSEEMAPPTVPFRFLLLKPSFPAPTAEAYRHWSDSKFLPGIPYGEQDLDGWRLVNDLERPVFAKHRFLGELKSWLLRREETAAALMAGSGSTVFAVLHVGADAEALADAARAELDPKLWHATATCFTAGGLSGA